eukprot:gene18749-20639_t
MIAKHSVEQAIATSWDITIVVMKAGRFVYRIGMETCKTFCKGFNDDINGHYTCNTTDGSKICMKDWYGSECKKYGSKICMRDWYGHECKKYCQCHRSLYTKDVN